MCHWPNLFMFPIPIENYILENKFQKRIIIVVKSSLDAWHGSTRQTFINSREIKCHKSKRQEEYLEIKTYLHEHSWASSDIISWILIHCLKIITIYTLQRLQCLILITNLKIERERKKRKIVITLSLFFCLLLYLFPKEKNNHFTLFQLVKREKG